MVSTIEITPSQSAETFPVYDTVPLLPIYVPCYILCRRTMFFFCLEDLGRQVEDELLSLTEGKMRNQISLFIGDIRRR